MQVTDTLDTRMAQHAQYQLATRDTLHQGRAYEAYKLLGGDAKRTALVMRTSPEVIESLAHDFRWADSIEGDIGDNAKIAAFKSVRRLEALMLGRQLHRIIQRFVQKLEDDPAMAERMMVKFEDEGITAKVDTKALEGLVKAAAGADEICYRALGDKDAASGDKRDAVGDAIDLYQRMQNRFKGAMMPAVVEAKVAVAGE